MQKKPRRKLEEYALAITGWVGSLQSIIIHTFAFVVSFSLVLLGVLPFDRMLLVLTTVVSLEAIYLSIFIQMTINYTTETIEEVEQDIDEIQEDIDEIQKDVDEIQGDVEEMTEEEKEDDARKHAQKMTLEEIQMGLRKLMSDIEKLQK